MRIVTDALVIRHADYGDYDRMLTLVTPKHGRIEAVARGCRRLKSPLVNAAELFTSGEYTLFEKNGRLKFSAILIPNISPIPMVISIPPVKSAYNSNA
jgi:DNA repair protein RecO